MALSNDNLVKEETEYHRTKSGKLQPWRIWYYKCNNQGCERLIKLRKANLATATGYCKVCNGRKKPYGYLYNYLLTSTKHRAKHIPVEMTYEEFLTFTTQPVCHYCGTNLVWMPYQSGCKNGRTNLDRKDNNRGYSVENCVPCCWMCNSLRQDKLSYEEFCCLSEGLHKIAEMRKRGEDED